MADTKSHSIFKHSNILASGPEERYVLSAFRIIDKEDDSPTSAFDSQSAFHFRLSGILLVCDSIEKRVVMLDELRDEVEYGECGPSGWRGGP